MNHKHVLSKAAVCLLLFSILLPAVDEVYLLQQLVTPKKKMLLKLP